ncbi:MAG: hypothetical protein Q9161_009202 [Pseudevernia consocians]
MKVFDDGELNEHPDNARKEVEALTELMKSPNPIIYSAEQYPLRYVFQSIWQRVAKNRGADIGALEIYCRYAHALDIPDRVFEHHSMHEIATLASEIVLLQNDVLSFHKEQSMGVNHNIIHLFRQDGLSQQEAYDKVGDLLNKRYRAWYLAHSEIPLWGEPVDVQVQLYVKGCQDVVLANANWSASAQKKASLNSWKLQRTACESTEASFFENVIVEESRVVVLAEKDISWVQKVLGKWGEVKLEGKSGEEVLGDVRARQMGARVGKEKGEGDEVGEDKVERVMDVWGGEPSDRSSYNMVREVGNMDNVEDAMNINREIEERVLSDIFPLSAERSTFPRLGD